jgi:hypothetical protein
MHLEFLSRPYKCVGRKVLKFLNAWLICFKIKGKYLNNHHLARKNTIAEVVAKQDTGVYIKSKSL